MTPLIYPDYMKPQPKPQPRGETVAARCPVTSATVYVLPKFYHNSQMYCESCKQVHRVLREAEGVRLA